MAASVLSGTPASPPNLGSYSSSLEVGSVIWIGLPLSPAELLPCVAGACPADFMRFVTEGRNVGHLGVFDSLDATRACLEDRAEDCDSGTYGAIEGADVWEGRRPRAPTGPTSKRGISPPASK